ncbi:hypothetical protein Tco_0480631 [Tanacetum coccineum]
MFVIWPLALGLIRSVLRSGQYSSLSHWHLDSSGTSCISGNVCHLAIGTWTPPEHLAFRAILVTWPLALGLIRNVLHSEKCSSLGYWHLDSSRAFCVLGNVRHLSIGTWTHPWCETPTGVKMAKTLVM